MRNPNLVVTDANLDTICSSATGLVFVVTVNNTSDNDYNVDLTADKCCLSIGNEMNCDVLQVIGTCADRIPRGTIKTMRLVAPILDPFERVGHCLFHLDSKSSLNRKSMRNRVKINFDTRLENKHQSMIIPRNVRNCAGVDEDPLNDCQFVDCETYYNGKKPYFDRMLRKCSEVPKCSSHNDAQLVYDASSNKCIEVALKKEDMDFVKKLAESRHRTPKDIIIIKNVQEPVSHTDEKTSKTNKQYKESKTKSFNKKLNDLIKVSINTKPVAATTLASTEINNIDHNINSDLVKTVSFKFRCFNNIFKCCSVNFLGIIILIQCCCIFAMICFFPKPCACMNKKMMKNFLNYRQDVSVTTPLIDTSNIDTETTHYTSESNVDKKIKCYKACQKDVNMKGSMSDDILSKCITRRDWSSKHLKYTPEKHKTNSDICRIQEKSEHEDESVNEEKHISETKVDIEKETASREKEKKSALRKSIFRKLGTNSDSDEKTSKCDSSEKELQSHLYTFEMAEDTCAPPESVKNVEVPEADPVQKNTFSLSTEKAAQAEFSNDSIDDFLSERGMIYLAGDDLSKFSFNSSTDMKSSSTSGSSKTSKNNVVKNILSVFRRNSKVASSSDPGVKKSGASNLELLHISHASIYSSSNNGSDYKCLKKVKDSRTSL
ncbi:uncharacterized protein LOC106142076 [Amyelois transitella]|uniref:uncharacterized protein LOC106142076 n=1 Tax=Amyelois transitella TaxID=680683 RepID=UPI00298F437E|nr:uncharacterized protein LOC106142076 [Amyelois transitella]